MIRTVIEGSVWTKMEEGREGMRAEGDGKGSSSQETVPPSLSGLVSPRGLQMWSHLLATTCCVPALGLWEGLIGNHTHS